MDQRTLLQELREGSTPLPPICSTRPELAPGWGRSVSQVREAFRNSTPNGTGTQLNAEVAPFEPRDQIDASLTKENDESATPLPGSSMKAERYLRPDWTVKDPKRINCCLLVTGLPSAVTVTEFIHEMQIRRLGKIAAVCIVPSNPFIFTAAAKVTMWNRAGAESLRDAIRSRNFGFDGHKVKVWWNRLRATPQEEGHQSRVIQVTGHPKLVAPSELLPRFAPYFRFVMDDIVVKQPSPEEMTVEYRFSSFLDQACDAYLFIRTAHAWNEVSCFYRKDPCEPFEDDPPLHQPQRETGPREAVEQQEPVLPPSAGEP
ncbi:hypothetical protein PG985_013990 [Apiospora marii]|uniref:uncharacterized protein n=1 Tax=Apiospora marii TaxID=335849 RepID=UPI00312FA9F6